MRLNELRIGGWVIVKPFAQAVGGVEMSQSSPQICQVTSIMKLGDLAVVYVNDNILAPIPIEHIMGVPLSESTLEKGGFRKSHNPDGPAFHILANDGFSVRFTIEHWTNTYSDKHKNRFHANRVGGVKFVHEVQNLLQVLFGMELDFSFLRCTDVIMHFEEGNPQPIATTIKILEQ